MWVFRSFNKVVFVGWLAVVLFRTVKGVRESEYPVWDCACGMW